MIFQFRICFIQINLCKNTMKIYSLTHQNPTFISKAMNINQPIMLFILQIFKWSKQNCRFAFYN